MGWKLLIFVFHNQKIKRNYTAHLPFHIFLRPSYLPLFFFLFRPSIADAAGLEKHPQYVTWMCWIIFFDTLATLPFAKLTAGRPAQENMHLFV